MTRRLVGRLSLTLILLLLVSSLWAIVPSAQASSAHDTGGKNDCSIVESGNVTKPMVLSCVVHPIADGYADNLLPSKSFAGSGVIIVQNVPSVPVSITDAFMKFALNDTLPPGILKSSAKPENATLALYVRLMNFFYNATVEIHNAVPGNWTESSLTWNNMPAYDHNMSVSTNLVENGTWARWDVAQLIRPAFNSTGQLALAAVSPQTSWRNLVWFDSFEYPFSDGTTTPTLVLTFVEPYLTVVTPYPNVPVSIGESKIVTGADGVARTLLPWGSYDISIPETINIANGTRARFMAWADQNSAPSRVISIGNNLTLVAKYGTQHELTAHSPYGPITGTGWFFENTYANISIDPTAVPADGVAGWFGERYVFDHWTGACSGSAPQCQVLMSAPRSTSAVWRVDWTETWIAAAILAIATGLLFLSRNRQPLARLAVGHKKRSRQKTKHRRG